METMKKINGWWIEHDDVDPLIPLKELGFKIDEEPIESEPNSANKESIGGD